MKQAHSPIMFQTFSSAFLPKHIASYRVYLFDALETECLVHFLPEGIVEIVFQLDAPISSRSKDSTKWYHRPPAFVGGLHNNAYHLRFKGQQEAFGIRFFSGCFANFVSTPTHLFKNQLLAPSELWGESGEIWAKKMTMAPSAKDRINLSEQFFQEQFKQLSYFPSFQVCEYICQQKGHVQIQQLATQFHLSSARFRQLFNERVGISPKMYCRIQRIKHALQEQPDDTSLTDWAYQLGYFDQAHFTNDIKQVTGLSPKECQRIVFY